MASIWYEKCKNVQNFYFTGKRQKIITKIYRKLVIEDLFLLIVAISREHVSTEGTLAGEHVSTQGTLAYEHVSTEGTLGT